jgi:ribosomal protein L35
MKTNKSFTKRLKVTKNGKIVARKGGQNHFRAKSKRSTQMANKRSATLYMTPRAKRQFLINAK